MQSGGNILSNPWHLVNFNLGVDALKLSLHTTPGLAWHIGYCLYDRKRFDCKLIC